MGEELYTYEAVKKIKSCKLFDNTSGLNNYIPHLSYVLKIRTSFLLVTRKQNVSVNEYLKGYKLESRDLSRIYCPLKVMLQYPMTDISILNIKTS